MGVMFTNLANELGHHLVWSQKYCVNVPWGKVNTIHSGKSKYIMYIHIYITIYAHYCGLQSFHVALQTSTSLARFQILPLQTLLRCTRTRPAQLNDVYISDTVRLPIWPNLFASALVILVGDAKGAEPLHRRFQAVPSQIRPRGKKANLRSPTHGDSRLDVQLRPECLELPA